jgi:hypothetical protein
LRAYPVVESKGRVEFAQGRSCRFMPPGIIQTQSTAWVPSNTLILGLALTGLLILAWISAKDVLFEEWRFFLLEMRLRRARKTFPKHETLGFASRLADGTKHLFLGRPDFSTLHMDEPEPQNIFRLRVRKEIDKLVGREEYHGQKEQL